MALFDLGKIAKKLQEAGEEIAKTAADAAGKLPDVGKDIAKTVSGAAGKIPDIIPDEVTDVVKNVAQAGQDTLNNVVSSVTGGKSTEEAAEEERLQKELDEMVKAAQNLDIPDPEETVSVEGALKIIYCLMSVDGNVSPEEQEKFNLIGKEMDSQFTEHMDALIKECKERTKGADDAEERYEIIHDYVSDIIRESKVTNASGIRGKLLLWNLFAVIYSDASYSEEEKRLIRYICRTLRIDKTVSMEMEHTLKSLIAIEKEEDWLKTTTRQYKKVEERLNELADRKNAIMQSVYALIAD